MDTGLLIYLSIVITGIFILIFRGIKKDCLTNDDRAKELEAQMDSWLLTFKQSIGNLETVSEKVDSKK